MKKGSTRLALEIALLVAAILAVAGFVFRRAVYEPPAPVAVAVPQPAPAPVATPDEAIVVAVVGEVEGNLHGAAWKPLAVGQRLRAEDALRTARGGRTDLAVGDHARFTVDESSQVSIRELSDRVHRFKVNRGRLNVDYAPDGNRVVRIESEGSDAVAEARAARFSVLSTGTSVAIATDTGQVDVTAQQKTVQLPAGSQTVVLAGAAPAPAAPIPAKLLLKVAGATQKIEGLCARIEGSAAPGTEVFVDAVSVPVAAGGFFSVRVPRTPGKKEVRVVQRDATGRSESRTVPCAQGDVAARIKDFAIRWKKSAVPP